MRSAPVSIALVAALLVPAGPAHAAFHLMKVVEVHAGSGGAPNAQYVMLQMYAAGQSLVSGHSVRVFDSAGAAVGTFTFPANVANGASQSTILIGTAEVSAAFGVTPDLAMTAVIPATGGKVCFDAIDCVSWGNYQGVDVGVPVAAGGIPPGLAIRRRLDISGSSTLLDAGDDTGSSANDFYLGGPLPRNNAGVQCSNCPAVGVEDLPAPRGTTLRGTPNPFRGEVTLHLTLTRAGEVRVGIFDMAGRHVRSLEGSLPAGEHRLVWDGRDDAGRPVGRGLYAVRARHDGVLTTTRLVRLD